MCLWAVLALCAGRALTGAAGAAELPQVDLTDWTPPSIRTLGDDPFGKLVKYGRALMVDTANQIGPAAADPAKRFAGNNLTCQNCHLNAGTRPYSMPLTGVWGQFPQYRGREGEVGTLEERINGCMERSMNGRVLPLDGPEMKAYLARSRRRPRPRRTGLHADLCRLSRQGRPRPARRDRERLPVPAAVGPRQLQRRRRHDPRPQRSRLREAQHAARHQLRCARAHRRGRL
jgi:hypothetical protein